MTRKIPTALNVHKASKELGVQYSASENYRLSAEFLRVLSPSAEVRGHGNPVLQTGKRHVSIVAVEAIGHYAIKIMFDDGHDSGIYNWDYLSDLCLNQSSYWDDYIESLHSANASRDPGVSIVRLS